METDGTYWMILSQMIALVFRILPGDFSTYANAFENVKYLMGECTYLLPSKAMTLT